MTGFPRSPKLLKGGIVLVDPDTAAVQRVIGLQYNPDSLTAPCRCRGSARTPTVPRYSGSRGRRSRPSGWMRNST